MTARATYPQRIRELVAASPSRVAVHDVDGGEPRSLTWVQYAKGIGDVSAVLAARGIGPGRLLVIALPNGADHLIVAGAAWALGATVLALPWHQPAAERSAIVQLAQPSLVVAEDEELPSWRADLPDLPLLGHSDLASESGADVPVDRADVSDPGVVVATGGSTGRPKLIVPPTPWVFEGDGLTGLAHAIGLRPNQTQLVAGPLHHTSPFHTAHCGLVAGHTLVVMRRFDAEEAIRLIEHHGVQFVCLVPTMMRRMLEAQRFASADLSALQTIYHTGGSCPRWVKQAWIDRVGPDVLIEAYGGSEGIGSTVISGREWLQHPGSVGRPWNCDVAILDDSGQRLPVGQVGNVYLRPPAGAALSRYVGSPPPPTTSDGYCTIGDLGMLDGDGYLYLADRRVDMIVTGGANVYPAEVEHALTAHRGVADVAVIGVADPEWGQRVHAIVEIDPRHPSPDADELDALVRSALSSYKAPKSYEFVERLPRDEAGKLRRADLRAARAAGRDEWAQASESGGAGGTPGRESED